MSKPGKVLKNLCKRLKVRLTVKRGKKRVYKSVKVLKAQCKRKKKKKKKVKRKRKKIKKKRKKVKRRRKFGSNSLVDRITKLKLKDKYEKILKAAELKDSDSSKNLNDKFIKNLEELNKKVSEREIKEKINNEYLYYSTLTRGKIKAEKDWIKYQELFSTEISKYTPEQVKQATEIVKEFNKFVKDLKDTTCVPEGYKKVIKIGDKWEDIKRAILKKQAKNVKSLKDLEKVRINIDKICTNTEASRCINKIVYNLEGHVKKYDIKSLELKKLQEELGKEKDKSKKKDLEKKIEEKQKEKDKLENKQTEVRIKEVCKAPEKKVKKVKVKPEPECSPKKPCTGKGEICMDGECVFMLFGKKRKRKRKKKKVKRKRKKVKRKRKKKKKVKRKRKKKKKKKVKRKRRRRKFGASLAVDSDDEYYYSSGEEEMDDIFNRVSAALTLQALQRGRKARKEFKRKREEYRKLSPIQQLGYERNKKRLSKQEKKKAIEEEEMLKEAIEIENRKYKKRKLKDFIEEELQLLSLRTGILGRPLWSLSGQVTNLEKDNLAMNEMTIKYFLNNIFERKTEKEIREIIERLKNDVNKWKQEGGPPPRLDMYTEFGRRKRRRRKRKKVKRKSKPGKSLRNLCKRLKVRLTVKQGKKRVYKSVKVLKEQCNRKKKKKKKVKKKKVKRKVTRKRKFGVALDDQKQTATDNAENCKSNLVNLLDCALTNGNNVYRLQKDTPEKDIVSYYINLLDDQGRAPKMFDVAFKKKNGNLYSTFVGEKKKLTDGIISFVNTNPVMNDLQKKLNNINDKQQPEEAYILCINKTSFKVTRYHKLNVPENQKNCAVNAPVITYDSSSDFIREHILVDAPDNSFFVMMHTHPRYCREDNYDLVALRSFPTIDDIRTHLVLGVLEQQHLYGEECAIIDVILSRRDVFIFSTHREALKEIRELGNCVKKSL